LAGSILLLFASVLLETCAGWDLAEEGQLVAVFQIMLLGTYCACCLTSRNSLAVREKVATSAGMAELLEVCKILYHYTFLERRHWLWPCLGL